MIELYNNVFSTRRYQTADCKAKFGWKLYQKSCRSQLSAMLVYLTFYVCCISLLSHKSIAKPRAIVHVGPHKTSSTHIQSFLSTNYDSLVVENYYWPASIEGRQLGYKATALFAVALQQRDNDPYHIMPTMKVFFQSCLEQNRNIILSSEEFDGMSVDSIQLLKVLLQGFDVTVVCVYREFLSHLVSLHFELNRFEHDTHFSVPFSSYLLKVMDTPLSGALDPLLLLDRYASVFGHGNVTVIDLLGCAADGKDVIYALVCEVAGILCNDSTLNQHLNSNSAYSLVPSQVFSFYNVYVESQKGGTCKLCAKLRNAYKDFEATLKRDLAAHTVPPLPVTRSSLSMLVPYAEQMDSALRAQYGDRILHGNATANRAAMRRGVHVEALDVENFVSTPAWVQWIQHMYDVAVQKRQVCGCKI